MPTWFEKFCSHVGIEQCSEEERVESNYGYELHFEVYNEWHKNNESNVLTIFKYNSFYIMILIRGIFFKRN